MKDSTSTTLTKARQITLHARFQWALGIKPGDRVNVTMENQVITVRPQRFSLQEIFGSIPALPGDDAVDFDQRIHDAMEEGLAASTADAPRL